jgi:hypothetical protein
VPARYGGAIYSFTDLASPHTTTIIGSTISGNTAPEAGGGLFNSTGPTSIQYSTITNNTAPSGKGGGIASFGDTATLTTVLSTIVAGNTGGDVSYFGGATNSFQSLTYNLVGTGNATAAFNATGDQVGVNPQLGPLADNGGPTRTHALLPASPAIDAGDPAAVAGSGGVPVFDQRGGPYTRVYDGGNGPGARIDIGAYERNVAAAAVAGRQLFYNRSAFDGNNASINVSDDAAIAIDKTAYLPGAGLAGFQNVSSYSRGLNGIMIDLAGGGDHTSISLSTGTVAGGRDRVAAVDVARVGDAAGRTQASGDNRIGIARRSGGKRRGSRQADVADLVAPEEDVGRGKASAAGGQHLHFQPLILDRPVGPGNYHAVSTTCAGTGPHRNSTRSRRGCPEAGRIVVADLEHEVVGHAAIGNIGAITRINIGTAGPFAPDGDEAAAASASDGDTGVASALALPSSSRPVLVATSLASVAGRIGIVESRSRQVEACFEQWTLDDIEGAGYPDEDDTLEELLNALAAR